MSKSIEMLGKIFHGYEVLAKGGQCPKRLEHRWHIRCCTCSQTFEALGYYIRNGKAGKCRCRQRAHYDLTGRTFGLLTVICRGNKHPTKTSYFWVCRCECQAYVERTSESLKKSPRASCDDCREYRTKYEEHCEKMPEYAVFHSMHERCSNPKTQSYKHYGGRGIYVDKRWANFAQFIQDMGRRPIGGPRMTIERIDNDGPYSPENCKWATYKEQRANMGRRNRPACREASLL